MLEFTGSVGAGVLLLFILLLTIGTVLFDKALFLSLEDALRDANESELLLLPSISCCVSKFRRDSFATEDCNCCCDVPSELFFCFSSALLFGIIVF